MQAISPSAIWIKEPLADVAVVIVISAALPDYFLKRLQAAIDGWDQVAYLRVEHPQELRDNWLRVEGNPMESRPDACSEAHHLLSSVPPNCYLLDVEVEAAPCLAWLGSVLGHKLRVVELKDPAASAAAEDAQVEQVLSAVRTLAKILLQERCVL